MTWSLGWGAGAEDHCSDSAALLLRAHADKRQRLWGVLGREQPSLYQSFLIIQSFLKLFWDTCKWLHWARSSGQLHNLIPAVLSRICFSGHDYPRGPLLLILTEQVSNPSCLLPSQAFIQDSFWWNYSSAIQEERNTHIARNHRFNGLCCQSKGITLEGRWNLLGSQVFLSVLSRDIFEGFVTIAPRLWDRATLRAIFGEKQRDFSLASIWAKRMNWLLLLQ